ELPRLVVPVAAVRRPWWRRWQLSLSLAGAALVAAAILLVLVPRGGRGQAVAVPGRHLHVKGGGDISLELVRRRGDQVTRDPAGYRPGDEFQVMVTCSEGGRVDTRLVIFEGDTPEAPFERAPLDCGNQVVHPQAFRLTGTAPVTVCLVVGGEPGCLPLRPE
ncbi:MAG TPA: hypothetical protein VL172_13515, partial [Kofleriaceae bacterium]|nr:hypothetical protein [Kofleriaceae bacterium]